MKCHLKWTSIVAVSLFAAVVACQAEGTPHPEFVGQQEPIMMIGASLPLSGRMALPGTATNQGYEVWAAMVNESGGLLGREVRLLIYDNGSDGDVAVADYERLIVEDEVGLVVGPFSSFLVIPTSEVAARHGYAFVEPAGGAPEVFDRGLTNLFFAQPGESARQADPFAEYVLGLPPELRPKTFAVVSQDDPFALGVMERLKGLLLNGGMMLLYDETYPASTSDFSEIADELAAVDPDLLAGGTHLLDAIAQIEAYQEAGYQPRLSFFTTGTSVPDAFRGELGSATEGIFSSISWSPDADEYQNEVFAARYVEMFGGTLAEIPEDAANGFTVGQVLQQAIENTGSIDNATLIEELHRGTFDTVVGPLTFDETGAPHGSYMLLQWQGDYFVIVGPRNRAEMDPMPPPKPPW